MKIDVHNKSPLILGLVILLLISGTTSIVTAEPNAPTQTATLTLVKNVDNDQGGSATAGDFELTVDGGIVISGNPNELSPGTYTISENPKVGYEFVSITGELECPATLGGTIELAEDDDFTCTITNADVPAFKVVPTSGLITEEDATTDSFTVELTTTPTANVTIDLIQSSDPSEGTVDKSTLTFTPVNWSSPQVVTITGVEDFIDDGDQAYTIDLTGVTSDDTDYAALDPPNVSVTNIDDDTLGITVMPTSGLLTSESGLSDTFDVYLNTLPEENVTIPLSSSNENEGTIDKDSLTFTPGNWSDHQVVTVTGVDDPVPIADGPVPYTIETDPAVSGDSGYSGYNADDVDVINADNDSAGFTVSPQNGLWTTEGEEEATIQILLNTKPSSTVTLNFSSDDETEGKPVDSSDEINPNLWEPDTPYIYKIRGKDDTLVDGDKIYHVTITATSSDGNYNGPVANLEIINYDAPTIKWVLPIGDEGIYQVDCSAPIRLKVKSVGQEPIRKVRFYRWYEYPGLGGEIFYIGDVPSPPPYEETIQPTDLEVGYNQIYAYAFGPLPDEPGEIQTYSIHKRILIDLVGPCSSVYLPIISKP